MRPHICFKSLLVLTIGLILNSKISAQNISTAKVTIGLKNESLETAIKKIEQQSVFRFFYRNEEVRQLGLLNLKQDARTIEQTLAALLQNTALCFRQIDGNILIEVKNQQYAGEIKGKVINSSDKKPLASASVFLNNALIGATTADDGSFTLRHVKPGQYELIVSIIGFDTFHREITIDNSDIELPVFEVTPKTIVLNEIKIKPVDDPERNKNFEWFKSEFLGTSRMASECKILNPEAIDFNYNKKRGVLTASAAGFLKIENYALGYKIKYLLTDFIKDSSSTDLKKVRFRGSALFEEMKGTPMQVKRWQKRRQEVYQGSLMHFLRSGLNNSFEEEGFRVLRVTDIPNPERPERLLN